MWSVRRVATAKSSLVFSAGRGGRHRIRFSGHQKNPLPLLSVLRHSPCAYFSTTSLHTDGDGDDDNATNQRTDLNTRRKVDDDSLGSLSTIELDLSEQVREILSFHDEIEDSRVSQRWNREYGYTKRNNRQVSRATKANVLLHGDGGDDDDDNLASGIEQESSHGCLGETSSDSALFSESFVSMDEPASPVFGGLNESESATKEWLQEGFDQEKPKEDSADLIPENAVLAHTASACFDEEVEVTKDKSNAEKPFILGSDYASIDQQTAPLHSDDSLPQNQLLVSAASDLGKDQNSNSWVSTSDALPRAERDPMDEDSDFKLNRNSIAPALALLRTMNQQDWRLYDGTVEDADVMEDQFEDEFAEEAMQISSENEQENTQDSEVPIDDANCLDNFQHLLARAKVGAIDLQTAEYNAILARLAVASELDPDEISVLLMNVYWQMTKLASDGNQDAAPNSDTYEILLLTLSHRLGSIKTAADLVKSMIENRAAWTPETLVAAMHVLERRTLLDTAMEMLYNVVDDSDRIFKVPNRAFHSLLNMTKSVDAQDTALEVIQVCIKVS